MKTYNYWDHNYDYPGKLVFSVSLPDDKTITDADQLFFINQGKEPSKLYCIGCEIIPNQKGICNGN
jgi:hypothetical protein